MFYTTWYHLYNFKNSKNTHGGVLLLLVKLHGCFHVFKILQMVLNCAKRLICAKSFIKFYLPLLLTLLAPISQNGQTHSNNSSEIFWQIVWVYLTILVGLALKSLNWLLQIIISWHIKNCLSSVKHLKMYTTAEYKLHLSNCYTNLLVKCWFGITWKETV